MNSGFAKKRSLTRDTEKQKGVCTCMNFVLILLMIIGGAAGIFATFYILISCLLRSSRKSTEKSVLELLLWINMNRKGDSAVWRSPLLCLYSSIVTAVSGSSGAVSSSRTSSSSRFSSSSGITSVFSLTSRYFFIPVPAGMCLPMITFSFSPTR